SADAELFYQLGGDYQPLPLAEVGGTLQTWFGPGVGFALEDGHNATNAGAGLFHRAGDYELLYEVVDVATQSVLYASTQVDFSIDANAVLFDLSDLSQVYDGTPRAVTVAATPANATFDVLYEPSTGTCSGATGAASSTAPTDAGSYCVYVDATGSFSGSAVGTLVVAKATAAVSIDGAVANVVSRTFDGTAQVVTASSPAPLTGTIVV